MVRFLIFVVSDLEELILTMSLRCLHWPISELPAASLANTQEVVPEDTGQQRQRTCDHRWSQKKATHSYTRRLRSQPLSWMGPGDTTSHWSVCMTSFIMTIIMPIKPAQFNIAAINSITYCTNLCRCAWVNYCCCFGCDIGYCFLFIVFLLCVSTEHKEHTKVSCYRESRQLDSLVYFDTTTTTGAIYLSAIRANVLTSITGPAFFTNAVNHYIFRMCCNICSVFWHTSVCNAALETMITIIITKYYFIVIATIVGVKHFYDGTDFAVLLW